MTRKIDQAFDAAIQAAVSGARTNASRNSNLATTIFLISEDCRIQLVGWEDDRRPWERVGFVRDELVKAYKAVAIVYVAETTVNSPDGPCDGVLVYGYLSGRHPRAEARTFLLDVSRDLFPVSMNVPPKMTGWVREALSG